ISDYDTYRPFKGWLRKIIINTAVDNYRRNNKHQSVIPIDTIPDTETDEPDVSINLDADDILQLFNQLPAPYRVTFNLYEIEGYSHEEIGEMLGIATSTSRANLTRAKKMLKELYFAMNNTTKSCHEAV
ncbi:MAG TPA: RNA polymerase sigma factor, partial [Tenuifilaceae bacterium]|nr:RNA polymerase sigma factor [Tenuifilaceae bacterium]